MGGGILSFPISLSTLLVFSIVILGLLSIQNMLLYNTVEHETFVQLKDTHQIGESAVKVAVLSRFVNNDGPRDILGRDAFRSQDAKIVNVDDVKRQTLDLPTNIVTLAKEDDEIRDTVENVVSQSDARLEDAQNNVIRDIGEKAESQSDDPHTNNIRDSNDKGAMSQSDSSEVKMAEAGSSSGPSPPRRKNLIIIGLSRSGTSYMCHMFNQDPRIFNIYEPMQMLTHWRETDHLKFNYKEVANDVIDGIMTCNYTATENRLKFVNDFSTFWRYRFQSNVFSSEPFCKTPGVQETCVDIDPKVLENVCLNKYQHTVVKLTYSRLPVEGKIQTLFSALLRNPDVDTRILHFVRDPRGNYNSRIKLGWIRDYPNPAIAGDSEKICRIVENNIRYGNNLTGWIKDKYKMFRYVDMFTEPLKTAKEIYEFAGFDFPDSVRDWIIKTTMPSKEEEEKAKNNLMGLVRNSKENVEKWKKDAPPGRVKVIEKSCKNLIELMGHHFMYPPE